MFTYLHCYLPFTWDAQVRAGLVGQNAGIRFSQSITVEENLKFNRLAAKGGELYSLLAREKLPLYIDRLQGGCYIEDYPYDIRLIDDYRELLGESFWGFQMHEWMSNFKSDLNKLSSNGCPEWTEKAITETIRRAYPFPHLFLESMNAKELAETCRPRTCGEFLLASERLLLKRQAYTGYGLLTCDSAYLAFPMELRQGVKRIMPEIGAQTPDTRIQVAYARGMARAAGIPFGTYYEPWGGEPFSACCYQREGKNEWNIGSSADFPFHTEGGNGGSSRSMQRRMHLYSYLAGASFMAEEWGMCNTFYDWRDFELTPYGRVKLDFIRFTERYPDIGKPVIPAAVVLPKELPMLEGVRQDGDDYAGFPVSGEFAGKLRLARRGLKKLFCESEPMLGNETHSLLNCVLPDAIDIVNEDFLRADDYDILIDLTGSAEFAQKHREKLCDIAGIADRLNTVLPCVIKGGAMKQLTRTADGNYYILLLNNSGVERTVANGERLFAEAESSLTVSCKNGMSISALEGDGVLELDDGGVYHVRIPAGGWFFGRINKI